MLQCLGARVGRARSRRGGGMATGDLAAIFRNQHGVISQRQARSVGVSADAIWRRLKSGHWVAVHRGVYRLASSPLSWEARCRAALLWAGERGVLSHLTAARIHRLEGLPRHREEEPIDLT